MKIRKAKIYEHGKPETVTKITRSLDRKHWVKAYALSVAVSAGIIGNAKIKILFYIINHMDHGNKIYLTNKELAKRSRVGYATAARAISALEHAKIIRKSVRKIMLNPQIAVSVRDDKRARLLIEFNQKPDKDNKKTARKS